MDTQIATHEVDYPIQENGMDNTIASHLQVPTLGNPIDRY